MKLLAAVLSKFWWVLGIGLIGFFGTLILVPIVVCRLPEDYFLREEPPVRQWTWGHIGMQFGRNLVGAVLIVAGIAMLFMPGQGVLTILIGVACLNFRGKRHVMRWFLFRPGVLTGLNWMRHKANVPPFRSDPDARRLSHSPAS